MMRRLFLGSTVLFWLVVMGFWSSTLWLPRELAGDGALADSRFYTLADVGRHAGPGDCWMVIDGQVYDFSAYLSQHPADPSLMLVWCGKEASEAYRTKTKGRPHSPYADQLLPKYRIGALRPN
jgi:cytochrome b involved in lipid metabolism